MRRIPSVFLLLPFVVASLTLSSCTPQTPAPMPKSEAELITHGRYLVTVMACNDCHTPGYFYGSPDSTRKLSGSELGWKGPWGVTYAANLTPDPQTGIGAWSETDIVTALRTGKGPDGSLLLPPMPWTDYVALTDEDATSIAKYLKTLTPVIHKVPDRLPPEAPLTGAAFVLPAPPAWDAPKTPPPATP